MRGELYEKRENPQKAAWQKEYQEVERIVDKLGKPVDPGIRESVVALRVLGISTSGSCEGHLHKQKSKAPWIDIGYVSQELRDRLKEAEKAGKELDEKTKKWRLATWRRILQEQERLRALLDDFYRVRDVPPDRRLILQPYPDSGRVLSKGAELQEVNPPEVQREKLKEYQEEIRAFTSFLKARFLSQN